MLLVNKIGSKKEKKLLKMLIDADILGNGSARVVYDVNKTAIEKILGVTFPTNVVIKLGCGRAGYTQNKIEVNTYEAYGECGALAKIYGYGRFLLICEKVEVHDIREMDDYVNYDNDTAVIATDLCTGAEEVYGDIEYNFIMENCNKIAEMITSLTSRGFQCNADTFQLGLTSDGRIVCFDYGLDEGLFQECIGDTSSSVAYDDIRYISMCNSSWNHKWKQDKFFQAVARII